MELKMRHTRIFAAVAFLAAAFTTPAHASLIFGFSFLDANYGSDYVTGRILGLEDNRAGQAASSVIIDTYPDWLSGSFDNTNDAVLWNSVLDNSFDVTDGMITSSTFRATDIADSSPAFTNDILCLLNDGDYCEIASNHFAVFGLAGPYGLRTNSGTYPIEYTRLGSISATGSGAIGVPLPPALPLFAFGLVALGLALRGRSKRHK